MDDSFTKCCIVETVSRLEDGSDDGIFRPSFPCWCMCSDDDEEDGMKYTNTHRAPGPGSVRCSCSLVQLIGCCLVSYEQMICLFEAALFPHKPTTRSSSTTDRVHVQGVNMVNISGKPGLLFCSPSSSLLRTYTTADKCRREGRMIKQSAGEKKGSGNGSSLRFAFSRVYARVVHLLFDFMNIS